MKYQWKNLRESFKRCLAARSRQEKSGTAAQTLSRCKYFDQLTFLQEKVAHKDTVSNIHIDVQTPSLSPPSFTSYSNLSSPTSHLPSPRSSLSSPINDTTQKTPVTLSAQGGRRRAKPCDIIDTEIVNSLNSLNDLQRPEPEPESSDMLFCKTKTKPTCKVTVANCTLQYRV